MGYIPIFIVMGGVFFLWGMTAYHTLQNRKNEVQILATSLAEATPDQQNQRQRQHEAAIRLYNATVADGAAKFWAFVFGFKKMS